MSSALSSPLPCEPAAAFGRRRYVVAMSGGVDSSVAAALLVEQGHEVVGVALRLYDAPSERRVGRCCAPEDLEDARRVAELLGIPFYVVDQSEDFRRSVEDDLVREYLGGRTPNPCVRCNEKVKFAPLLRRARALGGVLATGHYARLEERGTRRWLRRGCDAQRDQSYFLFMLEGAALEVCFPVGDLTKDQVRARARALGLPVADKPDSQEICFIADGDVAAYVDRRRAESGAPAELGGTVVSTDGRTLGQHHGVHHYTIGQRKGLGSLPVVGGEPPERRYVVGLDAVRRQVVVGRPEELLASVARIDDVRWPHGMPDGPRRYQVQIRHRHRSAPAWVTPLEGGAGRAAEVRFDDPQRAIAPGQAAVFYDGDWVVGGGWIA
jgi:tRNA-specific 2-thiouridylase